MEIETQLRRWMALAIFSLIAISSTAVLANSQNDKRIIHATWMDDPPVIDGDLSEGAWQKAKVATDFFRATQPQGIPAKLHTEAMVLYSEDTLYIGVYCEEPNISNLRQTATRRDSSVWQDDAIEVLLDTYNDQRNSYVFVVNTLNTQMDGKISNESNFDRSWDAKWDAKVQKNGDHWTAEFAIPFRELRFG